MTTENVAILFTDIVGSTELSQRLSVEVADEVRRGHFSLLRQAITEAGGTEVKNLGDGIMVVFGSASAALGCAVAMQQAVEQDNRGNEKAVGFRVGLSGGEVSKEDDDYFGDPVVEAARLCARCESGQVLASEWLRLTAGRRNRHACRSLGELALKGLPDPVETVEILWEPLGGAETGGSIPLPARLALRPPVGVVGRETEVTVIGEAVKRMAGGDGRELLIVSGEAGLGKTTLVAESARSAFDNGACVLFGHCEEDLATPYQLFAEALGQYVTHASEEQLLAHVAVHGSELTRLVPALASRIPDLPLSRATDSDTERFLLFAAVVGLLATLSAHQPIVLVLDDLQWADNGSLLLLRHLLVSDTPMRLLVLGTYRDELSQTHPLIETLAALHRQSAVTRIDLAGLDDNGVVTFLEAVASQLLDDDAFGLAHAIYRETDGNPFFVSEVLRHLTETGAISQDGTGRWVAPDSLDQLALPDSVRMVIGARVGRLGREAGRVLSLASVIGQDFDLDLLARATQTGEDDLLDILDAAAGVSLVRELADAPGRFNFAHALIQHTLYEDLGPTRRARAHRRVAEALEEFCGERPGIRVGELARHWIAALPIDFAKAIRYSQQAGDAALGALAPADALRYYAQALDLQSEIADPDPVRALDVAIGLGTAQRQTGDPTYRVTLLTAARQAADLGDTDRQVAAALANDRGYTSNSNATDTGKVDVLEMALDRLPADHPDRALVLATLCSELTAGSPLERLQALADEALVIAESTGDDATIIRVLNQVILPSLVPSLHEQTSARTSDALIRAERLGDPVLLFFAAHSRATSVFLAGDIDEMDRCIEIMASLARQIDQPILSWTNTYHLSKRAQIAGDTDLAEMLATEALQIGTDCGQPDAASFFAGQLLVVSAQRGTMGELIPLIEQMLDQASTDRPGVLTSALALAHAETDHTEDARRLLEEFAATDFDLPMTPGWITGMHCYAEAAIHCGDPKYAGPLFDRLAPWAEQSVASGSVTASGLVSHSLGGLATVLARYDEADAYFNQSSATSARMKAKFYGAATDLLWGSMLAERQAEGDTEKARDLLTKARSTAAVNGYRNVERRAAVALRLIDV